MDIFDIESLRRWNAIRIWDERCIVRSLDKRQRMLTRGLEHRESNDIIP